MTLPQRRRHGPVSSSSLQRGGRIKTFFMAGANYQGLLGVTMLLCFNLYLLHSLQNRMDLTRNINHHPPATAASSLLSSLYESFSQKQRITISFDNAHGGNEETMQSKYNHRLALKVSQIDYATIEQNPLREAPCLVEEGKIILMHDTHVLQWVCQQHSEHKVTAIMRHVFQSACSVEEHVAADEYNYDSTPIRHATRALVVDVGSNSGFYGLYAIAMGCETLFFDLQKQCHNMIRNELIVNGFLKHGRVFGNGISDRSTTMEVPDDSGCDGRFPVSKHEVEERLAMQLQWEENLVEARYNDPFGSETKGIVELHTLDHFIDPAQPIVMMKIDTEGHEHFVLSGSMHFFEKRLIRNAIVEITPGHRFWEFAHTTREQVAETFQKIASFGYTMISLWDWTRHETPDVVYHYIINASFAQSDMWLTLDDISDMKISELHQSVPDPPTPPPVTERDHYAAADDDDYTRRKLDRQNSDKDDADGKVEEQGTEDNLRLEVDTDIETEQLR